MDRVRVSLAIVNYNSTKLTARLLSSLDGAVDEVIVVDNASPDGDLDDLRARFPRVDVVELDRNVGYGSAANVAARRATGDVLVVSNPDVIVSTADLQRLAGDLRANGAALVAPRIVFPSGELQRSALRREPGLWATAVELCYPLTALCERYAPDRHPTLYSRADHHRPLVPKSVLGALLVIDLDRFRSIGGFDEAFFLYREENDLCRRLRMSGGAINYIPDVEAVHDSGGSTADHELTQTRPAYLESNLRFIRKWRGPVVAALAWIIGLGGSAVWAVVGPRRPAARRVVAWHLRHFSAGRSPAAAP